MTLLRFLPKILGGPAPARPLALALAFALSLAAANAAGPARAAGDPPPPLPAYALPNTAVHVLHASHLGRDYEIDVALPPSYARFPDRRYPVVFVTDAPYAFPLARAIDARVSGHSREMPEFILVGLGYALGDTPEFSRRRDYTPTTAGEAHAVSDMPGRAPAFGGASAYRRFLADEVMPFIATHYRADMTRRVFAGHSYGSLLGVDILTTEPRLFQAYVLGSPSLWYDHHRMLAQLRSWTPDPRAPADVYLGVGGRETTNGRDGEEDMVGDLRAFSSALAARRGGRDGGGLRLRTEVIPGEDHLTVAPTLITHGLIWALGPR